LALKVLKTLDTVSDFIEKILRPIAITCLVGMLTAVLMGVFTRNINFPITWLEEISRYLQIWFVFLGMGIALKRGELVGTKFLLNALPPLLNKIVLIAGKLLILWFLVSIIKYSQVLNHLLLATGQLSPNLRIPIIWAYSAIWVGASFMVFFNVVSILHDIFSDKESSVNILSQKKRR